MDYGDTLVLTTIAIYLYKLFGATSYNFCKNGFAFKYNFENEDEYLASTGNWVDIGLDAVTFSVAVYELIYLWNDE